MNVEINRKRYVRIIELNPTNPLSSCVHIFHFLPLSIIHRRRSYFESLTAHSRPPNNKAPKSFISLPYPQQNSLHLFQSLLTRSLILFL
jgi:hypothetical protein